MALIRRRVLGPALRPRHWRSMNLQVNSNLALERPSEPAFEPPQAKTDPRAELAAQFIPFGARVLDLSANATLARALPGGCKLSGKGRGGKKRTSVDILNAGDFPTEAASECDVIVMLGALEHIADLEHLFTHLRFCKRDVILSYCATDLSKGCDRAALGFLNHLSFYDLTLLFDRYGFRIKCTTPVDDNQVLMRLTQSEWLAPTEVATVAGVSEDAGGDFGGRVGRHIINSLLPGDADVHHLTLPTLNEARDSYDLVVLGTGNGLFPPLLGD